MSDQFGIEKLFERALTEILARVSVCADLAPLTASTPSVAPIVAVAYSGGLDSSVLLHLSQRFAREHGMSLIALHVHHGISAHANSWLDHCRAKAEESGVAFDARLVQLADVGASGVEQAARRSRYAALGEMCRAHGVKLMLTAHHQDDQAETVLLQLMRGSGVAGLSGMDRCNTAAEMLGDAELVMARPLLGLSRSQLERYAQEQAIGHVVDESNDDPRFTRNALRHQVMPALATCFPGFQERLTRSASHMQSAQRLLDELAAQNLQACLQATCLDVVQLQTLSQDRIDNLLRYWLGMHGVRMPSAAWLSELRRQLLGAKADAQICVTHPDCHIRRYRNRVYLTPRESMDPAAVAPQYFRWCDEGAIHFPGFRGTLCFAPAEQGINAAWLRGQALQLRYRQGGERLKPAPNRPTRSLKHHYQALDVPAWERDRSPLVWAASELLFAAGIGMDCHHVGAGEGPKIRLEWLHDPAALNLEHR